VQSKKDKTFVLSNPKKTKWGVFLYGDAGRNCLNELAVALPSLEYRYAHYQRSYELESLQ